MIVTYLPEAMRRAEYRILEDGICCGWPAASPCVRTTAGSYLERGLAAIAMNWAADEE